MIHLITFRCSNCVDNRHVPRGARDTVSRVPCNATWCAIYSNSVHEFASRALGRGWGDLLIIKRKYDHVIQKGASKIMMQ